MQGVWNGCAWAAWFRLDALHSGIVAADGTGGVIAEPTLADAALILTDDVANDILLTSTDWAPDAKGVHTVTISVSDPAVIAFLKIAAPAKAGSSAGIEKKEYVSEKGNKAGGTSSGSGVPYVCISAMGYNDTQIMTKMGVVNVSPESGKASAKVGELQFWDIKQTTIAAKDDVVIPNALFPATIFDIAPEISEANRTIEETAYIQTSMLAKAA